MFERFTDAARSVVVQAQVQARRFGHGYIGSEHLLLAAAAGTEPASDALRACGITPDAVRREIIRRAGSRPGPGTEGGRPDGGQAGGLLSDLDRDALASIGIDLDVVRAKLEERFGPGALAREHPGLRHAARRGLRGTCGRGLRGVARVLPRRRCRSGPVADLCGRAGATGHLPLTPAAKKSLARSLVEARTLHDSHIGMEHLALGLTGMRAGAVPAILSGLGVSPVTVRMAVLNRYRKAS